MPITHVTVTKKLPADVKADLMEYFAEQICANTSTLSKNIYVYIHEMEKENVRKLAPTVLIDWTMMPDRTDDAKKPIMAAMTDKLAEVCGEEYRQEIVIIFNDIPLASAMLAAKHGRKILRSELIMLRQPVDRLPFFSGVIHMANFIEISDFAAPELDVYARLTENQLLCRRDPENAMFIAESPMVIERALDAGCVPLSFLMETKHAEGKARDILARCPEDINVYTAELEVLTQLTGFHLTRGMLCAMLRPKLRKVEDVCCGARRIAVLENVMNPTNIGAIFRSAAALGMDAVLLTAEGSDPLYRRAVRVSMGTVFQVPWTYLGEDWMGQLNSLGFKTAAMALTDKSLPIYDPAPAKEPKLAVVLGTEGDGLASETVAGCDYTLRIPMSHGVDSLNVAAASAVAFYQLGVMHKL